jgi:hypothetical protein
LCSLKALCVAFVLRRNGDEVQISETSDATRPQLLLLVHLSVSGAPDGRSHDVSLSSRIQIFGLCVFWHRLYSGFSFHVWHQHASCFTCYATGKFCEGAISGEANLSSPSGSATGSSDGDEVDLLATEPEVCIPWPAPHVTFPTFFKHT